LATPSNMAPNLIETALKLSSIFLPYASDRRERVRKRKGRFVHYTSAANALSIIKTKRIWMRNATCMADFREVGHGLDALNRYFNKDSNRQAFIAALNECSAGAAEEGFVLFNHWWQNTQLQTYITSISEHDDSEDMHGRLSMWRAFGSATTPRVALVINLPLDAAANVALSVTLSPVGYFTDEEVTRELDSVTQNVQQNRDFLASLEHRTLVTFVFTMLVAQVVYLKHEGFHEEREWRIVHSPKRTPSPFLESAVESPSGVPQLVYKIPLENNSSAGISGLSICDLLDRVIIGPSQFPWVMYEAFVTALDAAGVKDSASRVLTSTIPVRT
jgi:hypothetical protein